MYFIVDIILIVYSYSTHKPTAHESPWARLKITLSLANEYVVQGEIFELWRI